ncbi:hypothetical protein F0562_020761 [Nyssa sinensis]|uniref:Uncharacterized protein n=1 Tax=Nyssa sinensis TaxID=561372 RepID=A0A5J5BSG5_9ASTE|nr:hypothetical protein F0562_020761 [Nyssa sinensis]
MVAKATIPSIVYCRETQSPTKSVLRLSEANHDNNNRKLMPNFLIPFTEKPKSSRCLLLVYSLRLLLRRRQRLGFIGWYLGMVKSQPILTKSITSALVYTAADLSSQTIALPSSESYDLVRTLRMAGYGMLILGPSLHFWFNFASKALPKRDLITTFKKIVMGQALYGPTMTVVFFSLNAGLQGENGAEIIARLKRDLIPTMISGVMYWPFCDFVTFKFIPVHLQPLVSNSFSYLWTVYLTYMASLEKASTE